jgi:hypothetical protein
MSDTGGVTISELEDVYYLKIPISKSDPHATHRGVVVDEEELENVKELISEVLEQ